MERYVFQPWGREGGRPGASGRTALVSADGARAEIGKIDVLRMPPRSTLVVQTAGGGGYGDPYARDPALVLADVLDGLVTPEQARDDYGVAIAESRVDEAETRRRRQRGPRRHPRFDFGPGRLAHERRWPGTVQSAVNRLTAALAPAPRQYVRARLLEAFEADGGPRDETALRALYARVMDELEVSLLEGL
jgi:N-methylhydantoinase B